MEIETKRFNDKIINLKGYNKSEKKCGYLYKKIGPKFMSYFIIKHQKYIILEKIPFKLSKHLKPSHNLCKK